MEKLKAVYISIIIPTYKVELYIERCIKSVICQTFTNYEVILIDDASPDNSLQIATQLLKENNIVFQTIKHKENKKQGTARNNGLKIAKGKYIFFIDADDELANKNVLKTLYIEAQKDNYDFVTAKEKLIEKGKEKVERKANNTITILKDTEILKALSESSVTGTVWNNLIRKDFLLKNNIWFPEGGYFEDVPYSFIVCAMAKKVAVLNEVTYLYYFQENKNATTSNLNEQKIKDVIFMCKEMLSFAEKNKIHIKIGKEKIYLILSQTVLYILAHPSLIKERKEWKKVYILFQKMYRESFLYEWKNKLFLTGNIAYFVMKFIHKGLGFRGEGVLLRPLKKVYEINF